MTTREEMLEAALKSKDEEIEKLKAKVEEAYKKVNRLIDIKWNYESILDRISSDEVAEAKGELGLDYCDFDPDYYPEPKEEEEDESDRAEG
jgi:hypothetical protein